MVAFAARLLRAFDPTSAILTNPLSATAIPELILTPILFPAIFAACSIFLYAAL